MNRRSSLMMAMSASVAGGVDAMSSSNPASYLSGTRYLEVGHTRIQAIIDSVAPATFSNTQRAVALFNYVRDEIPFGFASGFWNQTATEVLEAGVGYCNTKSTLLTALLRTAGVPARQVFVDIDAAVLTGLIDTGTPYLDHSYVEVFLNGAWQATDAFIVDPALFKAAQKRVLEENRRFGYGIHHQGTITWDGRASAFSQYNISDTQPLGTRRWGVYPDIGAFYDHADGPWNRLNALLRAGFGVLSAEANARADRLRNA